MEKVVLSRSGSEYELVVDGVQETKDKLTVTFLPGEKTVEELLADWEGNATITVKIDDTSIRVIRNFTLCNSVTLTKNYLIKTKYVCPECAAEVEPTATTCAACNAAFESPTIQEVRDTVCTVVCKIPDINDRMSDAEDSIEDIIDTILG